MDPDLLRQRRNVIGISSILLLFDFADVTISKIGILGTDLLVGNVRVLMWTAWVVWAYFLLRYYQYWRTQSNQTVRTAYRQQMQNIGNQYWYANKATSANLGRQPHVEKISFLRWQVVVSEYVPHKGGSIEEKYPVPMWRSASWALKSAWHVAAHTHHATDHVLPFALALAAPLVTFIPILLGS